jgi:hypothetical protein
MGHRHLRILLLSMRSSRLDGTSRDRSIKHKTNRSGSRRPYAAAFLVVTHHIRCRLPRVSSGPWRLLGMVRPARLRGLRLWAGEKLVLRLGMRRPSHDSTRASRPSCQRCTKRDTLQGCDIRSGEVHIYRGRNIRNRHGRFCLHGRMGQVFWVPCGTQRDCLSQSRFTRTPANTN